MKQVPDFRKTLLLITLAALFLFAPSSFAAVGPIIGPCTGTRALLPLLPGAPDPCSSPAAYVVYWFYLSLYLAGIAALLILVFAGFMRLASGIVPGAVSSANKMVTGAALGLILLFSGWLLLKTLNPDLLTISDSSFPPIGGYIMGFSPQKIRAKESAVLSWAFFFEKVDHGILNCYVKDKQTIKDAKKAPYGDISYKSPDTDTEGPHFCRITAQDKDNNTVGMGYADLIVSPECDLTWTSGSKTEGKIAWKTSPGAEKANFECMSAFTVCKDGKTHKTCYYEPPGDGSATVQGSGTDKCVLIITQPWEKACPIDIKFPSP